MSKISVNHMAYTKAWNLMSKTADEIEATKRLVNALTNLVAYVLVPVFVVFFAAVIYRIIVW